MKFSKFAAVATILFASVAAQAQNVVICTLVGVDNGKGVKPISGKRLVVNVGARKLRTETESYVGNGRENYNKRGEKWYGYQNEVTGENAVVVFGKDGVMSLIAVIDNTTLHTECSKV